MVARSRTWPPTQTSLTRNRTRSQPRSLLSMARLNSARSRQRRSSWSSNADCPDLPRFQGAFLANQLALVPWGSRKAHQRWDRGVHDSFLDPNRARRSAGHPLTPRRYDSDGGSVRQSRPRVCRIASRGSCPISVVTNLANPIQPFTPHSEMSGAPNANSCGGWSHSLPHERRSTTESVAVAPSFRWRDPMTIEPLRSGQHPDRQRFVAA